MDVGIDVEQGRRFDRLGRLRREQLIRFSCHRYCNRERSDPPAAIGLLLIQTQSRRL